MADDAEDLSNPRAGGVGGGGAASPLRKVAARINVPLTSVNTSRQLSSAQSDVENAQSGLAAARRHFEGAYLRTSSKGESIGTTDFRNSSRYGNCFGPSAQFGLLHRSAGATTGKAHRKLRRPWQ